MSVEVFMPKMTDFMEEGIIVNWLVEEGDRVEQGQPFLEVETDKAIAGVEAPASGFIKGIREGTQKGSTVRVGDTIAYIVDELEEEVPKLEPLSEEVATTESRDDASTISTESADSGQKSPVRATPVARRIAKDLGIDLGMVPGSGPAGRISEKDVHHFAEQQRTGQPAGTTKKVTPSITETMTPKPASDFEWLELNNIQKLTGQRMLTSVNTAPQFALTTSADMSNTLQLQAILAELIEKETGRKLSITGILVKVVASALMKYPRANASFENDKVKLWKQINIGVAIGTENGLVVPVIKAADSKFLSQITSELNTYQEKANNLRFSPDELSGGTFTISNLGMYGIDRFNAILNPPEAAILAVGRTIPTPIAAEDGNVTVRPMVQLTLTIDHRCLDGMQGAKFLSEVKVYLENPYLFLYQTG
jgi:pyruvate dehydrogenase E2 component (dihydrolipoamide acetyltransferase)